MIIITYFCIILNKIYCLYKVITNDFRLLVTGFLITPFYGVINYECYVKSTICFKENLYLFYYRLIRSYKEKTVGICEL